MAAANDQHGVMKRLHPQTQAALDALLAELPKSRKRKRIESLEVGRPLLQPEEESPLLTHFEMYKLGAPWGLEELQSYACSRIRACLQKTLPPDFIRVMRSMCKDGSTKFPFWNDFIRGCLNSEILDSKFVDNELVQLRMEC